MRLRNKLFEPHDHRHQGVLGNIFGETLVAQEPPRHTHTYLPPLSENGV